MLKSPSGKMSYNHQRLVRITEGRTDVNLSTRAQRAQIIDNFHAEHANTSLRLELYRKTQAERDASSMSMDSEDPDFDSSSKSTASSASSVVGTPIEEKSRFFTADTPQLSFSGSTLVSSPRPSDAEDDTSAFVREMEQTIKTLKEEQELEHKHKHKVLQH